MGKAYSNIEYEFSQFPHYHYLYNKHFKIQKREHQFSFTPLYSTVNSYTIEISSLPPSLPPPSLPPPVVTTTREVIMPTCPVCLDKPVNAAFIPCGHLACFEDATTINNTSRSCPVCRGPLAQILRIYPS